MCALIALMLFAATPVVARNWEDALATFGKCGFQKKDALTRSEVVRKNKVPARR